MDLIAAASSHGYLVTAAVVFLASLGFPLPVAITLLAAGAAARHDLRFESVLAIAWVSALVGDSLLFLAGRYTGWWLLAGICRLSMNPEQCIFSSARSFYRRGPATLLFAKFIPGLGTVAAPLAGSLNMRFPRFLRLMALGDALYTATWVTAGWLFYRLIHAIVSSLQSAGHVVLIAVLALIAGYALVLLWFTLRSRRFREIEKITATTLRDRIDTHGNNRVFVIADVRSHNYYDPGMQRIKNSVRVEPNRLQEELQALRDFMAPECEIYLYCSCIRDTTSVRVAHALKQANCRATVIEGGMKAWIRAGGELELVPASDVEHLPHFN